MIAASADVSVNRLKNRGVGPCGKVHAVFRPDGYRTSELGLTPALAVSLVLAVVLLILPNL